MRTLARDPVTKRLEQPLRWITGTEAVATAVEYQLKLWRGEYPSDLQAGMPYREKLLGVKNPSKSLATYVFRRALLQCSGVLGIRSIDVSFDRRTRKLSIRFRAISADGEPIDTNQKPLTVP